MSQANTLTHTLRRGAIKDNTTVCMIIQTQHRFNRTYDQMYQCHLWYALHRSVFTAREQQGYWEEEAVVVFLSFALKIMKGGHICVSATWEMLIFASYFLLPVMRCKPNIQTYNRVRIGHHFTGCRACVWWCLVVNQVGWLLSLFCTRGNTNWIIVTNTLSRNYN